MRLSRRSLLGASAALVVAAKFRTHANAAGHSRSPEQNQTPRSALPELLPETALPVYEADAVASAARRQLIIKQTSRTIDSLGPEGGVINVPYGDYREVGIDAFFEKDSAFTSGGRIILRGMAGPERPKFHHLSVETRRRFDAPVGLEVENIDFERTNGAGPAVEVKFFRYVSIEDSTIRGGRYGIDIPVGPTVLSLKNLDVARTDTGAQQAHLCNVNYIEKAVIEDSVFSSPQAEAHALRCLANDLTIRRCTFAHYWDEKDLSQGKHGELSFVHASAWSQTTFAGNTFYRRGLRARPVYIDLRNRIKLKGSLKFAPEWGTLPIDYHQIDNTNDASPLLFKHLVVDNTFYSGVSPISQKSDADVPSRDGFAIHNNGTCPTYTKGLERFLYDPRETALEKLYDYVVQTASNYLSGEEATRTPPDWQAKNERSVVYIYNNRFEGLPKPAKYSNQPKDNPEDRTPVRELTALPDWAQRRLIIT